jgi:tRNA modification GTPase
MITAQDNTIFALATPRGKSGVAVFRISGPEAHTVLPALDCKQPEPRLAQLQKLRHPATKELIDAALTLWFPAPHSFTGEEVVELHIHGSRAVITELMEALSALPGLRIAEPGEFSRRAFYNGKMDLAEAEGLADLIEAETKAQKQQALKQMGGALSEIADELRQQLLHSMAYLEAFIDFPEEEIPESAYAEIEEEATQIIKRLKTLLDDQRCGEIIRDGMRIAILGVPNAGKSSLLNCLAKRDIAIVSEQAGTTRDALEVHMDIMGYAVTLIDTAGMRETEEVIEKEGIRRARIQAEQANLRLLLIDPTQKYDSQLALFKLLRATDIVILTKEDMVQPDTQRALPKSQHVSASLSIHDEQSINRLLSIIKTHMDERFYLEESSVITRARHREAFTQALTAVESSLQQKDLELRAEELRYAASALATIIGMVGVEDILDIVFYSFCIGK